MRRKATILALLLAAATLLLVAPLSTVRAEEEEENYDGVLLEDVESPFNSYKEAAETVEDVVASEELAYESPEYDLKKFNFADNFDDAASPQRWVKSQAKKDDIAEEIAKYDGVWQWEPPQRIVWKNDIGLVLKSKAKHAAIAALLNKPFTFTEQAPLVVQYEVTMQDGQECGGSYIKLLSGDRHSNDLTKFNDKTPYSIMFGPDKCGNDVKMHFIFRHVNPINGTITEKHCRKPKDRLEEPFKDKLPHLYTLILHPSNDFEIYVDHKLINSGSLLKDFTPPVNPPREIDDPEDQKPKDWDEREKIPDPNAEKPEDWDDDAPPQLPDPTAVKPDGWLEDEPEMIPDPAATKPEDWESDIDGEWEAPLVDNPICEKAVGCGKWKAPLIPNKAYKGKWRAPLIENPNYQGKWAARKIPNPDYFEDLTPFKMQPIYAVGIELWSMSSDILFDNMIITDDVAVARDFAARSFDIKRKFIDKESETFLNKVIAYGTENPWSWRIALVLVVTPLAFSLYRMFSKGSSKETAEEEDAKKTDALQEDDDVTDATVADDISGGDASSNAKKSSPKKKKSDLDVKEETEELAASGGSDEKESDEAEEVEGGETEETAAKSSGGGGGGARKRRARKDQS